MMRLLPVLLAFAIALEAQTTSQSQSQIRHIRTSLNHLTVLEFGESVTSLAVGDPDGFEIERHDDKVFLKPLREGLSTNLFVWTRSREVSYELDPAGELQGMDVLVRAEPPESARLATPAASEPTDAEVQRLASLVLTEAMAGVEDIAHPRDRRQTKRVEARIDQIFRAKDQIYIRYSVVNRSGSPFRVTVPGVYAPLPTRQGISLLSLRDHQITPKAFSAFRARTAATVDVVRSDLRRQDLAPGESTTGVVSVGSAAGDRPRLYQLDFGSDQKGPLKIEAVL